MLDKLPTELSVHVVRTAAIELRFTNRQSVVNLALASNMVYNIVTPILYHTLIITEKTAGRIGAFTYDEDESTRAAAKRVLSHVRVLLDYTTTELSTNISLLPNVVNVSSMAKYARYLAVMQCENVAGPSLREITTIAADLKFFVNWIPQPSREFITHMTGMLPIFARGNHAYATFFSSSSAPAHGAEWWTRGILDPLPALTHIAFVLTTDINKDHNDIGAFDLGALKKALEAALAYPRLKQVVLKVCGEYVERRREAFDAVLRQIPDSRLGVVWEERLQKSWADYSEWNREDIVAGQSIWTRAIPVYTIS